MSVKYMELTRKIIAVLNKVEQADALIPYSVLAKEVGNYCSRNKYIMHILGELVFEDIRDYRHIPRSARVIKKPRVSKAGNLKGDTGYPGADFFTAYNLYQKTQVEDSRASWEKLFGLSVKVNKVID